MARIALTRDKIVQATIELAGKIGLSNVSFPRLAEYFGIKAPSLYNHFKNMEEVRVATAVYLQKELNYELTHAMVGLTPLAALRAYAESYKRFAEKYEAVYELINVIHQTNNGELEYLAKENIQCTLSVSLHATNDEKRSAMMPVNNSYHIGELMQACKDYISMTNKRISFEYALAKDNNDNLQDAQELVKLLRGMLCHVNLIPINKIENGKFTKSSNENIIKFRDYLNDHGIVATIRRELGSDIDAACGQLRRKNLKETK